MNLNTPYALSVLIDWKNLLQHFSYRCLYVLRLLDLSICQILVHNQSGPNHDIVIILYSVSVKLHASIDVHLLKYGKHEGKFDMNMPYLLN